MKKTKYSKSVISAIVLTATAITSASAATIYLDHDSGTAGLQNDYAANPTPGVAGGIVGGAPYTFYNTASDGSGTAVGVGHGDDVVYGAAGSIGDVTVTLGGHLNGGAVANSLSFGPVGDYTFVRVAGWNGMYINTDATVTVDPATTARFEATSVASGNIGTLTGGGTVEWANGNFTQSNLAINAGTFVVEQNHVSNLAPTITGAGALTYRGNAAPAFGQEWDIRSTTSNFSGGFNLVQGQIRIGASSTGVANAPTSGPLGTGTFTIGGEGNVNIYSEGAYQVHNSMNVSSAAGLKQILLGSGAGVWFSGDMNLDGDLTVTGNGAVTAGLNVHDVSGDGGFIIGSGSNATTLRLRSADDGSTYSGNTIVKAGSTLLVGESNVTSPNSVIELQGGTFSSSGAATQVIRGVEGTSGTLSTSASMTSLVLDTDAGDDLTYSGTVSLGNTGTYVVVKGGGKQTFNTDVGNVGRMDVTTAAEVAINNTLTVTGGIGVVVETGGILSGTGTVDLTGGGTLLVGDNVAGWGYVAPGNSIGTLAVNGDVDFTFKSDGTLLSEVDRNGGSELADLLTVDGDLTLGTISIINTGATLQIGDSFDLFDATGTVNTSSFALDTTAADLGGLSFDTSGISDGILTVIPEPSTYAALLGSLVMALAVVRRRRS